MKNNISTSVSIWKTSNMKLIVFGSINFCESEVFFGEQRAHKRQSMEIILKCKEVCKVYIERGNLIRYRCVRHYIANHQTQDTHILTCGMTSWTVMNSATKWLYQLMLSVGQVDRTRYRLLINYQQL